MSRRRRSQRLDGVPGPARVVAGLVYGALVAGAFAYFRHVSDDGGLRLLGVASLLAALVSGLLSARDVLPTLEHKTAMARAAAFAISHILLILAQREQTTTAVLCAAALGMLLAFVVAVPLTGEKAGRAQVGALAAAALAVVLFPRTLGAPLAVAAGVIQGVNYVLVRKLAERGTHPGGVIAWGFILMFIGSQFLLDTPATGSPLLGFDPKVAVFSALLLLGIQAALFVGLRMAPVQTVATLGVSRLVWAPLFEIGLLGARLPGRLLAAAVLLGAGAAFFFIERKIPLAPRGGDEPFPALD